MGQKSDLRARIEAVMAKRCPRDKVNGKGLPWKFVRHTRSEAFHGFRYKVPVGYSCLDIEKHVDALYAACGAVVEILDHAGEVTVKIMSKEFPVSIPFEAPMLDLGKDMTLLMGYTIEGTPILHDFGKIPHGMFAGQSQYGKTTFIQWLIFQLVNRFTPDELEIRIIDMKQSSFKEFRHLPHITKICRDLNSATKMLVDTHREMEKRGKAIFEDGADESKYKRILVIVDEGAQISPKMNGTQRKLANEAWTKAAQIACVGAELRLGVWWCTQRPDAEQGIHPQVKANVDMVCCFKVKTESNSRIVLDRAGAEKLPHKIPGRAIFSTTEDVVIQTPFIDKKRLPELLQPLCNPVEEVTDIDCSDEMGADEGEHFAELFGSEGDVHQPSGEGQLSWEWFPTEASVTSTSGTRSVRLSGGNE